MFFISSKKNDLYGVTDTSDWVEEFYPLDTLKDLLNQGIKIEKSISTQKDILRFFWYYNCVTGDVGSGSTMDLVDAYLTGDGSLKSLYSELGSSTMDTVVSLKELYVNIKKVWVDLNAYNIRNMPFYIELSDCINSQRGRVNSNIEKSINSISSKYHFNKEAIKTGLWL